MKKFILCCFCIGFISTLQAQTLSISNPIPDTVNEASGATQIFTVTLSAAQSYSVSVQYNAYAYTATSGTDFTAASGTLIFSPGQTSKTITISILDDLVFENTESYYVALSNGINMSNSSAISINPYFAYGYIRDNDPDVKISNASTPATVTEAAGVTQTFTVSITTAQTYSVSVQYQTNTGTATNGVDYVSASGTLVFAPGEVNKTITVTILNDYLNESQEYYYVSISNAQQVGSGTSIPISQYYGYGYIDDNDPTINMAATASPATVTEGPGVIQSFQVSLSSPQTYSVSVQYQAMNSSAASGSDFVASSGTLVFAPGETTKVVNVTILNDFLNEYQESYYLQISNALQANQGLPMTIGNYYCYGTIDDNDPQLSIQAPVPATVTEGAGVTQQFAVTLSAAQTYSVSVQYTSYNGSAQAGSDFTGVSGTLIFAPGQTTQTITVPILNDFLFEYQESYYIQLSNPLNLAANQPMSIYSAYAYGYLDDNDPVINILTNSTPATVTESSGQQQVFTIKMLPAQSYPVSVKYQTTNSNAAAGSDFVANSGTLVFAPGDTQKVVSVSILNDYLNEYQESYYLYIDSAKHAVNNSPMTISNYYGYATIDDDDPIINILTPTPQYVTESVTPVSNTYTVTLSAPQTYSVSVKYYTSVGSAVAGSDYIAQNSTLVFAPGETSKTITINVLNDYLHESQEFYYVYIDSARHVSNQMPMSIYYNSAYVYIDDDDPFINILAPQDVSENAAVQLYTVTLSAPQSYPVAVDYQAYSSYALLGSDFTFSTCELTVTFAPGETSKVIPISILEDLIQEPTEYYYVNISNARHAILSSPMTIQTFYAYGNILDNDAVSCSGNVLANPVINGTTLYCPGSTINLTVTPVAGALGYRWRGPNNFSAIGNSISIPSSSSMHSGVYTVKAFRSGGTPCDSSAGANVNISVVPCNSTVSVKLYIEGYYVDSGRMVPMLLSHGISSNTTVTDSIRIELRQTTAPYTMVNSAQVPLHTNGTALASFPGTTGTYYLAVLHRNALQTWSATPVTIGAIPATYDFSNAASKAYGSNMVQVEPGIWAFYSGDLNGDENIDLVDIGDIEQRINNFDTCYLPSDLNGDGNSDLLDTPQLENNVSNFIFSVHP